MEQKRNHFTKNNRNNYFIFGLCQSKHLEQSLNASCSFSHVLAFVFFSVIDPSLAYISSQSSTSPETTEMKRFGLTVCFLLGLVVVCMAEQGRATWHNPGPAQRGACGIVYSPQWNGGNWVAMVSQRLAVTCLSLTVLVVERSKMERIRRRSLGE